MHEIDILHTLHMMSPQLRHFTPGYSMGSTTMKASVSILRTSTQSAPSLLARQDEMMPKENPLESFPLSRAEGSSVPSPAGSICQKDVPVDSARLGQPTDKLILRALLRSCQNDFPNLPACSTALQRLLKQATISVTILTL